MSSLFKPTGNTPFEITEARLAQGQLQVKAAESLQELIRTLEECDIMINTWRDQFMDGTVDASTRALAIQALKERHACQAAIDSITTFMSQHFLIEA